MHKINISWFIAWLAPLLCFHFIATELNAQEAFKVDEVVDPRCDLSEVPQITDPPPSGAIFAKLDQNKGSKAAIIVSGMPGAAVIYANKVKRWLSEVRGVNPDRLVTLYGGPSDKMRLELWLIPQGSSLPGVDPVENNTTATLFDTYAYWNGETCGGGRRPALAEFAKALKRRVASQGFVVIRPHRNKLGVKEWEPGWDPDGYVSRHQALRRAARDKRYLVKRLGLSPTRVKTIVGDSNEWTHAELWIVPPGAEPPPGKAGSLVK